MTKPHRPAAGTSSVPLCGGGPPTGFRVPHGPAPSVRTPLSRYRLPAGQAYAATSAPATDDFLHDPPDPVVKGTEGCHTIQGDHRPALVDASGVTAS